MNPSFYFFSSFFQSDISILQKYTPFYYYFLKAKYSKNIFTLGTIKHYIQCRIY